MVKKRYLMPFMLSVGILGCMKNDYKPYEAAAFYPCSKVTDTVLITPDNYPNLPWKGEVAYIIYDMPEDGKISSDSCGRYDKNGGSDRIVILEDKTERPMPDDIFMKYKKIFDEIIEESFRYWDRHGYK